MRKFLILIAALTCFIAVISLCGCVVNEVSTADSPQNSNDDLIDDKNCNEPSGNQLYTVIYVDGDAELEKTMVSEGSLATNKTAPEKKDYNFVGWTVDGNTFDFTTPIKSDITLTASYAPIIYTAVYKANGKVVDSVDYSVENKELASPAVPERYGYRGEWENVEMSGNVEINAIYTAVVYKAKFEINGMTVAVVDFTIEDESLPEPDLTPVNHYTVEWESYEISARNITVNAIYTPITYYINFSSGKVLTTVPYTILDKKINEPEPVQKVGYTAVWEPYDIDFTNTTVEAVYTLINYNITFVANGQVVGSTTFNIENIDDVNAPQIPQRLGFECKWQSFWFEPNDIVVNAEYIMTFKDEFTYTLSTDKSYYTVTGYTGSENYLVIPSEHNGLSVKNIGEKAFLNRMDFTYVDICNGIEVIEEGAFYACRALKKISLPESLIAINYGAFAYSTILEIEIPQNVQTIAEGAFNNCASLTSLTIKGKTAIGDNAFGKCQCLCNVDLGKSVESIGANAFNNCTSIEKIYIPASVKEIGASAFRGCTRLLLVEFENISGWSVILNNNTPCEIYKEDIEKRCAAAKMLSVIYVSYRWICN